MAANKQRIRQLAQNVKDDPDDTFSKFALALELLKDNRVQKARLLFETILKQDPGYLGVYYHLGKLYQQLEKYDKAETLYRDGIELAGEKNELRTKSELSEALVQLRFETED